MKKLDKFIHTIPLAVAMQTSQSAASIHLDRTGNATESKVESHVNPDGSLAGDRPVFGNRSNHRQPEAFVLNFAQENRAWIGENEEAFNNLVTKEAIGTITPAELERLNHLQILRRQKKAPATGEEILLRHRREKLDRELVKLLEHHVRLQRPAY